MWAGIQPWVVAAVIAVAAIGGVKLLPNLRENGQSESVQQAVQQVIDPIKKGQSDLQSSLSLLTANVGNQTKATEKLLDGIQKLQEQKPPDFVKLLQDVKVDPAQKLGEISTKLATVEQKLADAEVTKLLMEQAAKKMELKAKLAEADLKEFREEMESPIGRIKKEAAIQKLRLSTPYQREVERKLKYREGEFNSWLVAAESRHHQFMEEIDPALRQNREDQFNVWKKKLEEEFYRKQKILRDRWEMEAKNKTKRDED